MPGTEFALTWPFLKGHNLRLQTAHNGLNRGRSPPAPVPAPLRTPAHPRLFERRVLRHPLTTHTTLSTHIFRATESSTQTAQFLASLEPKSAEMVEENRLLQQAGFKTLSTGYFLYLPEKVFHRLGFSGGDASKRPLRRPIRGPCPGTRIGNGTP